MGWTAGALSQPFTARAAIEFDLGADFTARVIDTVRYGTVIYAAVRSREDQEIWGLVLLAERRAGILYTKPISEDMGPAEDRCPARILDLLSEPSNDHARQWRERCRARLAKPRPRKGQTRRFHQAAHVHQRRGTQHVHLPRRLAVSHYHGCECHIRCWQELQFTMASDRRPLGRKGLRAAAQGRG